jgi:hypothetical protein
MDNQNTKESIEKEIYQEGYIEALKSTVEDLKMALYTISLMDNIVDAKELAEQMLGDFYVDDNLIKKTTLQKEKDRFK